MIVFTRRLRSFLSTLPLALVLACDGEGGDSNDEAAGTEDDSAETETGDESESGSKTDAGTLDDDGPGDFGSDAMDDGDTGLTGCAANETEADCASAAGCTSVFGKAVVDDGAGGWCQEAVEQYIGCIEQSTLCPPGSKLLCDNEGGVWSTSECVPQNLVSCEAPGDIADNC